MAKRVLPLRAGRSVRWTFEVSADVGALRGARVKKAASKRQRTTPRAKKPPLPAEPAPPVDSVRPAATPSAAPPAGLSQKAAGWRGGILAIAAVLVIAALAFPRRPVASGAAGQAERRQAADTVAPTTPLPAAATMATAAHDAAPTVVLPRAVAEPSTKSSVKPVTNRLTKSAKAVAQVPVAAAVAAGVSHSDDPAPEPAVHEAPTSLASVSTEAVTVPLVTITGCLEISTDGDSFRLSDVEGADAPKSRSWRTGFLKKRPAPVALVNPPDRPALATNVGHRVAATGQLAGRDLNVRSVRLVSSSCN